MTTPRHRCPWFWSGLLTGLLLGALCIHTGTSTSHGTNHPHPGLGHS
jgi:hypothetical protein